jgi:hypothetical protein
MVGSFAGGIYWRIFGVTEVPGRSSIKARFPQKISTYSNSHESAQIPPNWCVTDAQTAQNQVLIQLHHFRIGRILSLPDPREQAHVPRFWALSARGKAANNFTGDKMHRPKCVQRRSAVLQTTTVRLSMSHNAWLAEVIAGIRRRTDKTCNRSRLLRGLTDGLRSGGLDVTLCRSETEIRDRIVRALSRPAGAVTQNAAPAHRRLPGLDLPEGSAVTRRCSHDAN